MLKRRRKRKTVHGNDYHYFFPLWPCEYRILSLQGSLECTSNVLSQQPILKDISLDFLNQYQIIQIKIALNTTDAN